MIRVGALTSGRKTPSTRFRVRQHIEPLRSHGIDVEEIFPVIDKDLGVPGWPENVRQRYLALVFPVYVAWQGVKILTGLPGVLGTLRKQITWLSRQLLPGYLTLEPILKRPILFDIDDAIWLGGPLASRAAMTTARLSDGVIAGNAYLADWFSRYTKNVTIVPTAVDGDLFKPVPDLHYFSDLFTIGWVGSRSNLAHLLAIERPLSLFLNKYRDARLLVVSDQFPRFTTIPPQSMIFTPWNEKNEIELFQKIHLGLMPLPDNDWTKGKCAFKMLQYMSCGIPVAVSPVGMNKEVFAQGRLGIAAKNNEEWFEAFEFFYQNRSEARAMGNTGRNVVMQRYDQKIITARIAEIIFGMV